MEYITIQKFDETNIVKTICTKKQKSPEEPKGIWKYNEKGSLENYEKLGRFFGIALTDMVRVKQTHTDRVRVVTKENGGEEILRPASLSGFDGMITNEKGLLLCTLQADCVPVFLLDPVRKVIGMVHSGWKGTANRISVNAVRQMKETYGTDPADVMAAMGPCICGSCYEVGEELLSSFAKNFRAEERGVFFWPVGEAKYLLDLAKAIKIALVKEGLQEDAVIMPPSCTFHDREFFSYRKDKDLAGRMLTGIMLK